MEEVRVEPNSTFTDFQKHMGMYYDTATNIIDVNHDIRVIDSSTSNVLFILRKKCIPSELIETTVKSYLPIVKKTTSSSRGLAAGGSDNTVSPSGTRSRIKSKLVHSMIAGYIDSPNNKYPCRLTQFSNKFYDTYQNGMPFIKHVDSVFKKTLPIKYANQREYADKTQYSIFDTCFTTVTVNYNFQTALHVDKGDCIDGFGVLVVSSKNTEGGYILFPRFDIGVRVEEGDILFMNVHEYHCNSNITYLDHNAYRVSFVFYLRTRLLNCRQNDILNELGIEEGKHWNTSILVSDILKKIGVDEKKKESEVSPKEWVVSNNRFTFLYKNRQYKLHDKTNKKHIINLYNIWNYLKVTANL